MNNNNKKIKVLFGGAFDIFHWMHLNAIRNAASYGDYLIMMVNSDKLVGEYKVGRKLYFNENERADIIRNLKFVDEVVIKDKFSEVDIIKEKNIDVFVICDEWVKEKKEEIKLMEERGGRVVIEPYTTRREFLDKMKEATRRMMDEKGMVLCEKCHQQT